MRHSLPDVNGKRRQQPLPGTARRLTALDPQLVCYSWISGWIAEVAMVVFVRKRMPEIQYLRTLKNNARSLRSW